MIKFLELFKHHWGNASTCEEFFGLQFYAYIPEHSKIVFRVNMPRLHYGLLAPGHAHHRFSEVAQMVAFMIFKNSIVIQLQYTVTFYLGHKELRFTFCSEILAASGLGRWGWWAEPNSEHFGDLSAAFQSPPPQMHPQQLKPFQWISRTPEAVMSVSICRFLPPFRMQLTLAFCFQYLPPLFLLLIFPLTFADGPPHSLMVPELVKGGGGAWQCRIALHKGDVDGEVAQGFCFHNGSISFFGN